MNIEIRNQYINKMISFDYETGCIPAGAVCYCYSVDPSSKMIWVYFKDQILGRNNIKLHEQVIIDHGRIVKKHAHII